VQQWVAPRGWHVELIELNDQQILRARRGGFLQGYCKNIAELDKLLERDGLTLGHLVEVLPAAGPISMAGGSCRP
jgi:hypothetical protein